MSLTRFNLGFNTGLRVENLIVANQIIYKVLYGLFTQRALSSGNEVR
jgi:hypothetical protein